MPELCRANYQDFPAVSPPPYDLDAVKIGVIHMGLGAFHRAHQAVYFERLLRSGNLNYGVAAVSQRSEKEAATLSRQDCLYTVDAQDNGVHHPMMVGAIRRALFFPSDRSELLEIAASNDLKLITLTVTEKAYQLGALIPIRILELLAARYAVRKDGVAIISCDNLPRNGEFLRSILLETGREMDPAFIRWMKDECRFPNSMVDRIVPAISEKAITEFERIFGYRDLSLISTELFSQWVISDDPISRDLSGVGVESVADIDAYEKMKIRLFNGAHSALAYIGQLSGIEYLAQAIVEPRIAAFVAEMQEKELAKSFQVPQGVDLVSYAAQARSRISNRSLFHRTAQVAMDGSQKLPQRLFSSANDLYAQGISPARISFIIAAWIHYLSTKRDISDPLAQELQTFAREQDAKVAVKKILTTQRLATKVEPALFPAISHWLIELRSNDLLDVMARVGLEF